jgi:hypothetical protein
LLEFNYWQGMTMLYRSYFSVPFILAEISATVGLLRGERDITEPKVSPEEEERIYMTVAGA